MSHLHLLFSAPWPAVSLRVNHHILQIEASLMKAERCINVCIQWQIFRIQMLQPIFLSIIFLIKLNFIHNIPSWSFFITLSNSDIHSTIFHLPIEFPWMCFKHSCAFFCLESLAVDTCSFMVGLEDHEFGSSLSLVVRSCHVKIREKYWIILSCP